jgi:hypothetical protein
VAVLSLLGVLWVVAVRISLGGLIGDPVHPVTYVGVLGGVVGALVTLAAIQWRDRDYSLATRSLSSAIADGDPAEYRQQGATVHVVYGAIAGGCYPRVAWMLGFEGHQFAALPYSATVGVGFGLLAFVVALAFGLAGVVDLDLDGQIVATAVTRHVLYGLVVGAVVGLWQPYLAALT